jgi:phosphoribosyl-dephospho-CoA transferase
MKEKTGPDLELLKEFVKVFESIPQRYCLFCEASAQLGSRGHRRDCPFGLAKKLIERQVKK